MNAKFLDLQMAPESGNGRVAINIDDIADIHRSPHDEVLYVTIKNNERGCWIIAAEYDDVVKAIDAVKIKATERPKAPVRQIQAIPAKNAPKPT